MEGGERKIDGYEASKRTGWIKEKNEVETGYIGLLKRKYG